MPCKKGIAVEACNGRHRRDHVRRGAERLEPALIEPSVVKVEEVGRHACDVKRLGSLEGTAGAGHLPASLEGCRRQTRADVAEAEDEEAHWRMKSAFTPAC